MQANVSANQSKKWFDMKSAAIGFMSLLLIAAAIFAVVFVVVRKRHNAARSLKKIINEDSLTNASRVAPQKQFLVPDTFVLNNNVLPVAFAPYKEVRTGPDAKTLVIRQHWHGSSKERDTLNYFLKHGTEPRPNIDYVLVVNGEFSPEFQALVPRHVKIVLRDNKNIDFGAWSEILDKMIPEGKEHESTYDNIIVVNGTVMGPFIPLYDEDKDWTKIFTKKLSSITRLVGCSINVYMRGSGRSRRVHSHVQSMVLCFDVNTLKISRKKYGMWNAHKEPRRSKDYAIENWELGFSEKLLKDNFNIACCLPVYHNMDFRSITPEFASKIVPHTGSDLWTDRGMYGSTPHPYETIFMKWNRTISMDSRPNHDMIQTTSNMIKWHEIAHRIEENSKM